MGPVEELLRVFGQLQKEAHKRIAECANRQDLGGISRYTAIVRECMQVEHQLVRIMHAEKHIRRLLNMPPERLTDEFVSADLSRSGMPPVDYPELMLKGGLHKGESRGAAPERKPISRKQAAKEVRERWIEMISDQTVARLKRITNLIYELEDGRRVGVAFANELDAYPDRWFLGLPAEEREGRPGYDVIVLLCQTRHEELLDFVLPIRLLQEDWERLSRDKHGKQVKFNLRREGSGMHIMIPKGENKPINLYRSRYSVLWGQYPSQEEQA